jgi:predicted membrane channel-forming protein YqfA (hemolysin III family)
MHGAEKARACIMLGWCAHKGYACAMAAAAEVRNEPENRPLSVLFFLSFGGLLSVFMFPDATETSLCSLFPLFRRSAVCFLFRNDTDL